MNFLIVTDIFGKTPHLAHLARQLGPTVQFVDPFNNHLQSPVNEQLQYARFIQACGHDNYFEKVMFAFNRLSTPTTVIAFSAGGTAAWRSQARTKHNNIKRLVAFYPSQVRHYLSVDAKLPCEFIFPTKEAHFELPPIIAALQAKPNVECSQTEYQHGFMNPLSDGFDNQGFQKYSRQLLGFTDTEVNPKLALKGNLL